MVYDYVVIGSGLSGLVVASTLSQETSKVLLLEASDHPGGWLTKLHLPFLPGTPSAQSAIFSLENFLGLKILGDLQDSHLLTFENSEFKPFLGFGEKTPDFYDEMAYFCHPQKYQLKLNPQDWVSQLVQKFQGTFSPHSIVTKFLVEEGKLHGLLVNGTKKILAHNFIYCGELKALDRLVPQDFFSAKAKSKLTKTKTWTRATLEIQHQFEVTQNQDIHILMGTSQEEIVTCVGQFQNQSSLWTTFVADEETEDPEITGQALKRIKRQIKRAYADAFSKNPSERIVVQSGFGGHFDLKLNANQTWPELENLWVANGGLQADRNLLGTLKQTWLVLASLGFGSHQTYERHQENSSGSMPLEA